MNIDTTKYRDARNFIEDGDLLLFRNGGLIPWFSEGPYSHAGIALWRGRVLALAESREFKGARVVTLSSQVQEYPGRIDVYRPRCSKGLRSLAADIAFRQAGHPYNYAGIFWASLLRLPLIRLVLQWRFGIYIDPTANERTVWGTLKFCSQQALWCYCSAAKWLHERFQPVPGMADSFVTPNHLSHSPDFQLLYRGLVL